MKIALIGYGQMGKTIEQVALKRGHTVGAIFGKEGINTEQLAKCDVAIEFSKPEVAFNNISSALQAKVPVICGTTGWLAHYEKAVQLTEQTNSAFLYASNFSLGVNIFFEINKQLARIMDGQGQYDVAMQEIHHTKKLDAPSGTAITLAEQIIENVARKTDWSLEGATEKSIEIEAIREPNVPGTHSITYQSEIDTIEIKHTAHNRQGFALGAVLAAEFLHSKKGVYTMRDVLNF